MCRVHRSSWFAVFRAPPLSSSVAACHAGVGSDHHGTGKDRGLGMSIFLFHFCHYFAEFVMSLSLFIQNQVSGALDALATASPALAEALREQKRKLDGVLKGFGDVVESPTKRQRRR